MGGTADIPYYPVAFNVLDYGATGNGTGEIILQASSVA